MALFSIPNFGGLYGSHIEELLKSKPATQSIFRGVFNALTLFTKAPMYINMSAKNIIVFNSASDEPGEHWLLLLVDGQAGFFGDSLDRLPSFYSQQLEDFILQYCYQYSTMEFAVQNPSSNLCGLYCLYWATAYANDELREAIKQLTPVNRNANDEFVLKWFKKQYNMSLAHYMHQSEFKRGLRSVE